MSKSFDHPFFITFTEKNKLSIVSRFLKTIALENEISVHKLVECLTRWYFKLNHKKLGIILYGSTNSRKSLLADLLTSMYKVWEVGMFSCPGGSSVSRSTL